MKSNTLALRPPVSGRTLVALFVALTLLLPLVMVTAAQADRTVWVSGTHDKDAHKRYVKTYEMARDKKAFLGISMQSLTEDIAKGLDLDADGGVLISDVVKGSPADEAGIEEGDVIVEFNGQKVDSPDVLGELVADSDIGEGVEITVLRDGRTETLEVTLGDWSEQKNEFLFSMPHDMNFGKMGNHFVAMMRPWQLGVHVSELNEDLAPYFGVEEGEGMLVLSVEDESTASGIGIKAGDVIVEIGEEEIRSKDDIHDVMSELDEGDKIEVVVIRKKRATTLEGEVVEGGPSWMESSVFDWKGTAPHVSPKIHMYHDNDEIREELDELREELDELRKEMKKSKRTR